MAHVVIMGAGIGGLPAAYEMKAALKKLGGEHEVTVVSNVDYFHFVPSNPWVAVGWRTREDISFQVGPYLNKKGINFVASGVKQIHAKDNRLTLHNGQDLDYDYLFIATGPRLAFELIDGLGPDGHTQSICHVDHAFFFKLKYKNDKSIYKNIKLYPKFSLKYEYTELHFQHPDFHHHFLQGQKHGFLPVFFQLLLVVELPIHVFGQVRMHL